MGRTEGVSLRCDPCRREGRVSGCGVPIVMLQPWWRDITRPGMGTFRRAGAYRRDRDQRLTSLRRFAASHDWNTTALTADLSACCVIPSLVGARSAQAELTVTGEWQDRTALVASVLVQPAASASPPRRSGRPRDLVVLLVAMDVERNDRQLVASHAAGKIDVVGISGSVTAILQPVRVLLGEAAQSGVFCEGDTLKVSEADMALAHPALVRERALDVESRLDLLLDVTRLLAGV